ncbi:alcohol dehydrogenase catalytic domain-containing protein [Shewanella sp. 10N.286.48.B5]|uniref:alcohol dehydrogenase catalytic domain-containing protein n=1 Tax=Shewanella sp. 10N.286.48.B5 TaxID=1880834 RepID=UPI0039A4C295
MKQAKALISNGRGDYSVETIMVGLPKADEVRVKIKAAGLCHTDWDSIHNWNKTFIVGHEAAGIVDAVGSDISHLSIGDKVILNEGVTDSV